jgi:hypothetical protein
MKTIDRGEHSNMDDAAQVVAKTQQEWAAAVAEARAGSSAAGGRFLEGDGAGGVPRQQADGRLHARNYQRDAKQRHAVCRRQRGAVR